MADKITLADIRGRFAARGRIGVKDTAWLIGWVEGIEAIRSNEQERIASALDQEADTTPCDEDAKVVRDCARLVRADFSYDRAEQIAEHGLEATLRTELSAAIGERDRALAALAPLEWMHLFNRNIEMWQTKCPSCGNVQQYGHREDCKISAALSTSRKDGTS